MNSFTDFASLGLVASMLALLLLLLSLAGSAWLQAFATRRIARWAFQRVVQGKLWKLYFLAALPLWLIASLVSGADWPLAGLLILFFGTAPLLRHFMRWASHSVGTPSEWVAPGWSQCLALSSGAALAVLVAAVVLVLVVQVLGLGVLAALLAKLSY